MEEEIPFLKEGSLFEDDTKALTPEEIESALGKMEEENRQMKKLLYAALEQNKIIVGMLKGLHSKMKKMETLPQTSFLRKMLPWGRGK